ncbi:RNA polymerase sigma factor SigJ [Nocardioides sp. T2.26MG-1]|uniref:RNA polymerase sigma factor SigJ n=1 Tax=Nocardioides sp. T2.26MG-1 TaxID=3041166 RepID=UPI002477AB51|nr:RNA polymerase sigma factor SigJ [Nocardioides sp. T2.26MG-1]CAI9411038.1 ECF RNA polymerase sigma factor SigJ [Nocardioides sp. T2.26MG-1]
MLSAFLWALTGGDVAQTVDEGDGVPDSGGIQQLEEAFEAHRPRLRAVAYRMLGSTADADDALQETWLRVSRADLEPVANPAAWLTTVTSRVCLNVLRSRRQRREEPLVRIPDPVVSPEPGIDPEQSALLADHVGLALMVVLETLTPAERVAFVLHDMFGVAFDEVAPIVDRSPAAARQLASRARRRVRVDAPPPDPDPARQHEAVDAFFAASHDGDFEALVAILDPDVVLRSDGGTARPQLNLLVRGSDRVARQAVLTRRLAPFVRRVLVNGAPGAVVAPHGRPQVVMAFTVTGGRIVAVDVLADPERLARLDLG